MKKLIVFAVWLFVFIGPDIAVAEIGPRGFDVNLIVGVGTSTDENVRITEPMVFRFTYLDRLAFGLEVGFIMPYGFGTNLLIYVYRDNRIALHIFDPGIFWSVGPEISAPYLPRAFDITVGAGIEIRINEFLSIIADWRVFFPDPFRVVPDYADFGIRAYLDAVKGGELWVGVSFTLY